VPSLLAILLLVAVMVVLGAYWYWRLAVVMARHAVRDFLQQEYPPLPELGPGDDR